MTQNLQKAVFLLNGLDGVTQKIERLATSPELRGPIAIEFSRLALPHPNAKNSLEVCYLLTLWVGPGRRAKQFLGKSIVCLKEHFPGARFIDNSDIGLLNARVREIEDPVFCERIIRWGRTEPWALAHMLGEVRPSLISVTWHTAEDGSAAHRTFIELLQRIVGSPRQSYSGGRVVGLVRHFGMSKFGEQRSRVELDEPIFGTRALVPTNAGEFRTADDFARLLPLDQPDMPYGTRSEGSLPLVDRTGKGYFLDAFYQRQAGAHWLSGLRNEKGRRMLFELKAAAARSKWGVVELLASVSNIPKMPFAQGLRDGLLGVQIAYFWRIFYAYRLGLPLADANNLERAFQHVWLKRGPLATWEDVNLEAAAVGVNHPLLATLAFGIDVAMTEFEHTLYQVVLTMLVQTSQTAPQLVILPSIFSQASPLQADAVECLRALMTEATRLNMSLVVQITNFSPAVLGDCAGLTPDVQFLVTEPADALAAPEIKELLRRPNSGEGEIFLSSKGEGAGLYRFYQRHTAAAAAKSQTEHKVPGDVSANSAGS